MSVVVCAVCCLLCHDVLELVLSLFLLFSRPILLFSHLILFFSHLFQLFLYCSELVVAVVVVVVVVVIVVVAAGSLGCCWLLFFLFLLCVCGLLSWHVDLVDGERLSLVVVELTAVEVVDARTSFGLVDDCS